MSLLLSDWEEAPTPTCFLSFLCDSLIIVVNSRFDLFTHTYAPVSYYMFLGEIKEVLFYSPQEGASTSASASINIIKADSAYCFFHQQL